MSRDPLAPADSAYLATAYVVFEGRSERRPVLNGIHPLYVTSSSEETAREEMARYLEDRFGALPSPPSQMPIASFDPKRTPAGTTTRSADK